MSICINSYTERAYIPPPGRKAECMHMPDMAIMERWWRIFATGFGYALH